MTQISQYILIYLYIQLPIIFIVNSKNENIHSTGSHQNAHWRKTLRMRHLRQDIRLQPRSQGPQAIPLGRKNVQMHSLQRVLQLQEDPLGAH